MAPRPSSTSCSLLELDPVPAVLQVVPQSPAPSSCRPRPSRTWTQTEPPCICCQHAQQSGKSHKYLTRKPAVHLQCRLPASLLCLNDPPRRFPATPYPSPKPSLGMSFLPGFLRTGKLVHSYTHCWPQCQLHRRQSFPHQAALGLNM